MCGADMHKRNFIINARGFKMSLVSRFSRSLPRLIYGVFAQSSNYSGLARISRTHLKLLNDQTSSRCLRCLSSLHSLSWQRIPRRSISSASDSSLQTTQPPTDSIDKVSHEISAAGSRLFAVIFIAGLQYKITTNDLVQIHNHIEPDIGERIRIEKVLLVGGDNFTLLGRPLLGLDQVRVEATVIEKTLSQKYIRYLWRKRSGYKKYKEFVTKYTILRINSIEVSPNLK